MPRFFFHVRDSVSSIDEDGTELPDVDAARVAAVRLSGDLLKDHASTFWNGEEWTLEVTDESGLLLFTLLFIAFNAASTAREVADVG